MEIMSRKRVENSFQSGFLLGQAAVRTLGIAATLSAVVLMATSRQSISLFGGQFDANYSYSTAFKFAVAINSLACSFAILCLCGFLYFARLATPSQKLYYILFLIDLMVMVCLVMGSSAASAIGDLGRHGNNHAGWMPICDHFGKFCNRIMASLVMSYIATLLFLILTIWSSRKATTFRGQSPISDMENNLKRKENKIGDGSVSAT